MPIFDQFEIAANIDFSGSYTDTIISTFSGTGITDKKIIGSRTQPITSGSFNGFELSYNDYLYFAKGSAKGTNHHFVGYSDETETFYDSLVPSPIDYYEKDGGRILTANFQISGSNMLDVPSIPVSESIIIVKSAYYDSGETWEGADFEFFSSFPFEKKYTNLLRLKKVSQFLPRSYNSSIALSEDTALQNIPTRSLNINSGIILINVRQKGDLRYGGGPIFEYIFNNNYNYTYAKNILQTNTAASGVFIDKLQDVTASNYDMKFINKNLLESYKIWFGRNRKRTFRNRLWTDGTDFIDGTVVLGATQLRGSVFGINISGWKYGLYSAFPSKTSAIFRRNKFGNFRDMLEQRQYSRFDANGTTSQGPVVITFVSGTNSYVTSTNDSELNIKDSGIFRRDYTSGKPFADNL